MDNKGQKERDRAYSKIAQKYKKLFINELQNKPMDRKIYDLFFERVINHGEILEIGCGPGEISNYLWMKGLDITGIDYSKEMIKAAKEYNPEIKFIAGNVFKLKYDDHSIYGIIAPYLIVNFTLEEVKDSLIEMTRVLKKDGVLLISFHIGDDNSETYDNFIEDNNKITFTFFKVDTIVKIIEDVGLKLMEIVTRSPYNDKTTRAYIFAKK